MRPGRIFTVEEAEGLIDALGVVLEDIQGHMAEVRSLTDRIQVLDVLWGTDVEQEGNPDHAELLQLRAEAGDAVEHVEALIREEILARGVRFPVGGIEHGLLDFPTTLDGRVVYLCWKLGEAHVGHWHEVDGGFAGRQPVTAEIAARMGA